MRPKYSGFIGGSQMADGGRVMVCVLEGADDFVGVVGVGGEEERARGEEAEGVEIEGGGDALGNGVTQNGVAVYDEAEMAGVGEFGAGGGEAAFGGVVEGVEAGEGPGGARGGEDTDAGVVEEGGGEGDFVVGEAAVAKALRNFAGEEGGAFGGDGADLDDDVVGLSGVAGEEAVEGRFADHGAGNEGLGDAGGDFGVAADEGCADFVAGGAKVGEDCVDGGLNGVGWEEEGGEEPTRIGAEAGDVVGVDVDGVAAEVLGGERDGVGGEDEVAVG